MFHSTSHSHTVGWEMWQISLSFKGLMTSPESTLIRHIKVYSGTPTEKQPTLGSVLRALIASEEATKGAEMQEPAMFPRRLAFVYIHILCSLFGLKMRRMSIREAQQFLSVIPCLPLLFRAFMLSFCLGNLEDSLRMVRDAVLDNCYTLLMRSEKKERANWKFVILCNIMSVQNLHDFLPWNIKRIYSKAKQNRQ